MSLFAKVTQTKESDAAIRWAKGLKEEQDMRAEFGKLNANPGEDIDWRAKFQSQEQQLLAGGAPQPAIEGASKPALTNNQAALPAPGPKLG